MDRPVVRQDLDAIYEYVKQLRKLSDATLLNLTDDISEVENILDACPGSILINQT